MTKREMIETILIDNSKYTKTYSKYDSTVVYGQIILSMHSDNIIIQHPPVLYGPNNQSTNCISLISTISIEDMDIAVLDRSVPCVSLIEVVENGMVFTLTYLGKTHGTIIVNSEHISSICAVNDGGEIRIFPVGICEVPKVLFSASEEGI